MCSVSVLRSAFFESPGWPAHPKPFNVTDSPTPYALPQPHIPITTNHIPRWSYWHRARRPSTTSETLQFQAFIVDPASFLVTLKYPSKFRVSTGSSVQVALNPFCLLSGAPLPPRPLHSGQRVHLPFLYSHRRVGVPVCAAICHSSAYHCDSAYELACCIFVTSKYKVQGRSYCPLLSCTCAILRAIAFLSTEPSPGEPKTCPGRSRRSG